MAATPPVGVRAAQLQLAALLLLALLLAAGEQDELARNKLLVREVPRQLRPRITLVVQTFFGDRARFESSLAPSLRAFFDKRGAALHFVLDDDDSNRAWAVELVEAFPNATFAFAPEPPSSVMDAAPYRSLHNHPVVSRYASRGYTRMLFDFFFFDERLPPPAAGSSGDEVVAVIDADAMLYGVFPPLHLFPHGLSQLEVIAKPEDSWAGDALLLRESTPYDSMGTDVYPALFWRSTFAATRRYVIAAQKADDFPAAWCAVFGESVEGRALFMASPNVIFNYGLIHEAHRYKLTLQGLEETHPPYGSNRPKRADLCAGCCSTFELESCTPSGSFPSFYEATAVQIATLSAKEQSQMRLECHALCT